MSKLNISIVPDEQDPKSMKGIISLEFKLNLQEGEKLLKAVRDSNIIHLVIEKLSQTLSQMQTKDREE